MTEEDRSIFSRIIDREIPARIVAETETIIAFHDVAPQAPVHVLVVPKTAQYVTDPGLLAEMVNMAKSVADDLAQGDYRLVFNSGASAGQTVFHVHAHVLAGALEEGTLAG